jgi:hypothetical protein
MPAKTHPRAPRTPRNLTVVVLEGCPHADAALTQLELALQILGLDHLTPRDPFPVGDGITWACRLYSTPEGNRGVPTVAQLEEVPR